MTWCFCFKFHFSDIQYHLKPQHIYDGLLCIKNSKIQRLHEENMKDVIIMKLKNKDIQLENCLFDISEEGAKEEPQSWHV